ARRSEVVHERGRGRETSGANYEEHGGNTVRLLRHRQRRTRRAGSSLLGLRRHSDRVGRVHHAAERGADILDPSPVRRSVPPRFFFRRPFLLKPGEIPMSRLFVAALLSAFLSASLLPAIAQTPPPAPRKMSREHLHELYAKWKKNRPKLAACRREVKRKGLAG